MKKSYRKEKTNRHLPEQGPEQKILDPEQQVKRWRKLGQMQQRNQTAPY